MSKRALRNILNAIDDMPPIDFRSMKDKELLKFRFVELDKDNSKRLTRELKRRKLI